MNQPDVVVIDPDNRAQVAEIAALLDMPVDRLRPRLVELRDRQIVAGRIEEYWRNNPRPQPKRQL